MSKRIINKTQYLIKQFNPRLNRSQYWQIIPPEPHTSNESMFIAFYNGRGITAVLKHVSLNVI